MQIIKFGITDPVYPAYIDANIIDGRNNIVYLEGKEENGFLPEIPKEKLDIIYLCYPNNPSGAVMTKEELTKWIEYAKRNETIILFDSVYEAFITDDNIPHSIYEIEDAKKVSVEIRSYSKLAGFTGVRGSFLVVPNELKQKYEDKEISLNELWRRRQSVKFGATSYIVQRAAEAVYTEEGQKQIRENIRYYLENAKYIRENLKNAGFTLYGGENSPYIWLKVPKGETSWSFFDKLLNEAAVVTTPGEGFGKCGEGYIRITAFGSREDTKEAVERICALRKE